MCDAATNRRSFRAQLAGVLEKLTKVAVLEIGALAEECSLVLHTEISQRKSENEALKKKCFYLEVQLKAATTTRGSSSAQHYPPVNTAAGRRQQSQSHGHGGAILHVPEKLVCREPQQPDPAIEGVFGKDWCMDLWRGEKPDPPQSKERVGCSNIADVVVPQAIDLMDGEPDLIFVKEESYEDQPIAQETARHTDNRKSGGGGGGGGFEGSSSQRGVNELQLYPGELNNFPIMTTAGQSQQGGVQPTLMDKLIEDSTLGTLVDDANPPSSATGEYSEYANDIHGNPAKDLASQRAGKAAPKQFECLFCGKVFNYLSSLKVHIRRHSGEKPFSCTVCGKRFAQKTYLKLHQRVHSGEKPYTCQQCGKRFSQKSSLNIHLRTHTGEKPYSCVDCGKSYAYKYGFNQHQCFN